MRLRDANKHGKQNRLLREVLEQLLTKWVVFSASVSTKPDYSDDQLAQLLESIYPIHISIYRIHLYWCTLLIVL